MKKKYPIKILGGLILGGIYPDIPPRRYAPDHKPLLHQLFTRNSIS